MDEFAISNHLLHQPEALRARAREDGYLFFRRLIDAEAIQCVRLQILNLCREAGWLRPGSDPAEGIAAEGVAYVEPEPAFMEVYNRLQQLEDFHALAHQPQLLAMFDILFGEPTLVHARNIARIIFPQNLKFTTPAHQDYVHIQGTEETWTAWIPLGDCPQELGSLVILRGSHRQGVYPTHAAYGAGGLGIDTESLPYTWVGGDFLSGDVVVFHSLCVHKALPNLTPDRLRLSVDYRYQPLSQPVVESSFQPHHGQISWEEVYANWQSERYQYYWRNLPLRFADWTPEYHRAARRGCENPDPKR
jgi:ectoine hydroxylase-related dioxygenase (phytanoyl-CoA dioxygenase family)